VLFSLINTRSGINPPVFLASAAFLLLAVISESCSWSGMAAFQTGDYPMVFTGFLSASKVWLFLGEILKSLDTWQRGKRSLKFRLNPGCFDDAQDCPHLTHRRLIKFVDDLTPPADLAEFEYVLLNVRHPGGTGTPEFAARLVKQLKILSCFNYATT